MAGTSDGDGVERHAHSFDREPPVAFRRKPHSRRGEPAFVILRYVNRPGAMGRERVVRLVDGREIVVRPVRPDDRSLLEAGFARLGEESRYRRFLSATPKLTPGLVRYLTDVDHRDHEALVALDAATGVGIGVARFVRSVERPDSAEVAVAVVDDWHGRGVGTALLALLIDRARGEGVERFTGLVLAQNRPVFDLLGTFGDVQVQHREHGTVEVVVPLPAEGLGERLPSLLRAAAAGQLHLAPARVDP